MNNIHMNDKQNQKKHAKMARRLCNGILRKNESNSGRPGMSKIHPNCMYAKKRGIGH